MQNRLPLWKAQIAAAALFCLGTLTSQAQTIGPAVDNSYNSADGSGQRLNVDQTMPFLLEAGTYVVSGFTFYAMATSSQTTPFLVINSDLNTPNPAGDIDSYQIIAVGATRLTAPVAGTNIVQTQPFGGDATFTLTVPTKVFAAVSSGLADGTEANSIGFKNGGAVDHHNPGSTQYTPTVGANTPAFGFADLGRTYGFSITVTPVPEPGSAVLLSAGAAMLGARRRRQ